jgi:hypothetical protein
MVIRRVKSRTQETVRFFFCRNPGKPQFCGLLVRYQPVLFQVGIPFYTAFCLGLLSRNDFHSQFVSSPPKMALMPGYPRNQLGISGIPRQYEGIFLSQYGACGIT